MRIFYSLVFSFFLFWSFSQESTLPNDSCIHFENYNVYYKVDYRPKDEKVGTICSFKDLMPNKNVEISSVVIGVLANGNLFPMSSQGPNFNEQEIFNKLKKIIEKGFAEESTIMITLKAKFNGEEIKYPTITLISKDEK